MKLRVIRPIEVNGAHVDPGEFIELPEKEARRLIKDGEAIEWVEPKKKAVNDGDG
jgi:hypothetical protein